VAQALVLVKARDTPSAAEGAAPRETLLTIAPGHYVYDERVLRTVLVARRRYRCIYAVDHTLHRRAQREDPGLVRSIEDRLGEVEIVLLPPWRPVRLAARATRHLYAIRIARQARAARPGVVHIHESGILGLLIAFWVRRMVPGCRIIFDYHDWIPYELALGVRSVRPLYRVVHAATLPVLRRLARSVDTAVCVSPGHAEWTREHLGIADAVVVQNVRPRMDPPPEAGGDLRRDLLYVGHVMRMRRVEVLLDVLSRLRARGIAARLHVHGELTEPGYVREVQELARSLGLEASVAFHGRFSGDYQLAERVVRGTIGVVLSHADVLDTGINAVTSANKFFSYLTMGVPVLVEAPYINMAEIAARSGAGASFASAEDCADAAVAIWETPGAWDSMRAGALAAAGEMNSAAAERTIETLYAA
jgi:glycosyltransferase involved in cell wall biosynthesis